MEGAERIASNALAGAILRCAAAILHLGAALLLARLLGAEGYGAYAFALAASEILAVASARGLDLWAVRVTAAALADKAWGRLRGAVEGAPRAALRSGLAATVFAIPFLYLRGQIFAFVMVLVPALVLLRVRQASIRGLGRIIDGQWPEMIVRPGVLLLGAAVCGAAIGSRFGPAHAFAIQAGATILALAVAGARLGALLPAAAREAAAERMDDDLVRAGGPLFVVALTQVAFVHTDVAALGLLAPPAETGFYAAASQCALVLGLGMNSINAALAPSLSALHQSGDSARLRTTAARATRGSFAFACLACAALWIGAEPILSLFGEGFARAAWPLRILTLGYLTSAAMGPLGYLLLMTGHEKDAARGLALGAAAQVALLCALVPRYGALGAACSTATSVIGWNAILALHVRRRLGLGPFLLFA